MNEPTLAEQVSAFRRSRRLRRFPAAHWRARLASLLLQASEWLNPLVNP